MALVRALLLFEASMYSALAPVLPHYAHILHASKPAVGVLTGAYPAGIVPGSLVGAWVAARAGVRRTTLIGLGMFAVAVVAFGFGTDIVELDGLRFVQGAGCGFIWGGALAWVIAIAPRERRGAMLGTVISAAIFGTLLGPVLGTLAVTLNTEIVFSLVGAVAVALMAWTLQHPEPPAPEVDNPARPQTVIRDRRVRLGSWLIVLEAATVGATSTLIPLRLAHLGAAGIVIGATFLVASLISMLVSTPIGRIVDRRGPARPLYAGLAATAVLMALLTLPHSAALLVIVSVIALGAPLTMYTVPAMAIITDGTERSGMAAALASLLINLAWAGGEVVGAPAAARLSQATSDAVPLLALSAIMAVTLGVVIRARLDAAAGEPAEPHPPVPAAAR